MSMVAIEDDLIALGAEIIWVMEQNPASQPGTAQNCYDFMSQINATKGWCVGDSQTLPTAYTFDNSPFSRGRGFDIVVPKATMSIAYTTNHGTPAGNDNLNSTQLLAEFQGVITGL